MSYPPELFITAQLQTLIESQGVKKFLVYPDTPSSSSTPAELLLWVFNPSLLISSSSQTLLPTKPKRVMKIFYQRPVPVLSRSGADDLSTDELFLPPHILAILLVRLDKSQEMLPESARKLGAWQVGVLERWSPHYLEVTNNTS